MHCFSLQFPVFPVRSAEQWSFAVEPFNCHAFVCHVNRQNGFVAGQTKPDLQYLNPLSQRLHALPTVLSPFELTPANMHCLSLQFPVFPVTGPEQWSPLVGPFTCHAFVCHVNIQNPRLLPQSTPVLHQVFPSTWVQLRTIMNIKIRICIVK